jgi:hypothetical protein
MYTERVDEGHAAFWCDACLQGIALGPSRIPAEGERVRRDEASVPRYRLVQQPGGRGPSDLAG